MLLSGIRVIDFGRYIAGPYCGMMLADFGADVIRIDRRGGSEDRYLGPVAASGEGGMFLSINRNKRSVTLSPSKPGGHELIRRLVESADVVIANLPLVVMKKMGIDYDSLNAIKPNIILTMVSTFGPDGPYSERVGFDAVAQAMSGSLGLTGFPENPIKALVPFEDYGTALHAAFGTMAAIYHREKTGEGQLVDASLLATGVTFMTAFLAERHVTGVERGRQGNVAYWAAPSDVYKTKDGWVVIACNGGPMFARWARAVGREDLIAHEHTQTDLSRADHHTLIDEAMVPWCKDRTMQQVIDELEQARVPAGPVYTLDETLNDPQVKARKLLEYHPYPGAPKDVPLAAPPVRLSETPASIRSRAPQPGEHCDEVLAELGYSLEQIEQLRADATI